MESKELKKTLALVGLAGLVAAGSVGCARNGDKKADKDAVESEKGKTSCSGNSEQKSDTKTSCGGGTSCS